MTNENNITPLVNVSDIYSKISLELTKNNDYHTLTIPEKKNMIDQELTNYILEKLSLLGIYPQIETNVIDLLEILAPYLEKIGPVEPISHFTHSIINLIGNIQGPSIGWWPSSEKEDIGKHEWKPYKDHIGKFINHIDEDPLATFKYVYNFFINEYKVEPSPVKALGEKK